ncbi:MAG TPA: hypothetical protein DCW83_10210 [Saprospirales bacterium]|jgi:hypothetical protein|nr:hypothetical protein [Saprospirales bacterium]
MSYQIMSGEVAVPTAAEDATMFTPNNPDSTPNIRFSNYAATDAKIYYLNSAGLEIGCMTLRAGRDIVLHKRRTYHKFWAEGSDVRAVPVIVTATTVG